MIRAVIFDLDNTLMPEPTFWDASFEAVCGEVCADHNVPLAVLQARVFGAADQIWRTSLHAALYDALGLGTPSWLFGDFTEVPIELAHLRETVRDEQHQAWTVALGAAGIRDRRLAVRLADRFRAEREAHHEVYDDVLPVLTTLTGRYGLGILSNGVGEVQRAKLRAAALDRFFSAVAISGELGVGKPDARAFERTLAMLGATADEAVMVGDSLERDVIAAKACGIATVWLNRTDEPESAHPHTTITSLEQLSTVLDQLEA